MRGRSFLAVVAMGLVTGVVACGSNDSAELAGDYEGDSGSGAGSSTGTGTTADPDPNPDPDDPSVDNPNAGTLTAGDWDDNLNWDWFTRYREDFLQVFGGVASVEVEDRIIVSIVSAQGEPISNAKVTITQVDQTVLLTAPTGSDGRLLFFPGHDGAADNDVLQITVEPPSEQSNVAPITVPTPNSSGEWRVTLPNAQELAPSALDLAFVVDATGSMSDELGYLQAEIQGIADDVKQQFANVDMRFALIVYRDHGDAYVTRAFDFTADLDTFKVDLNAQNAAGGGDFPEAMATAMAEMNGLAWRDGNVARVSFLVADAPPHEVDGAETLALADEARLAGIRLYPVAASGVDSEAEYYLRQSAELTLGRYLFLTDDSGVGNSHAEPHIPCYQVQYLNQLIARMIASELAGERINAGEEDVIREVGNPDANGVCKLADGSEVSF